VISPTNVCNAKCIFCARKKVNLKPKIMGMKLFKKSVDQLLRLGVKEVGLTPTIGDVFVDKEIAEKIKYAKGKGVKVAFITNGILLKKNNNYKEIIDAGTDEITISVGDTDENYDSKIYGITQQASRDRWDGIFRLLQYAENVNAKAKISISFRPVRPPYQIVKTEKFKALKRSPNVTIDFLFCYDNWCGNISKEDLSGIMRLYRGFKKMGICLGLYKVIIMPDGKVRLCGCRIKDRENDELVMGDITVSDLAEILENRKTKETRENFAKGIYPEVCIDCTMYRRAK
jgi:radical SAM protein with 4Fe4S-binding SPASM domain